MTVHSFGASQRKVLPINYVMRSCWRFHNRVAGVKTSVYCCKQQSYSYSSFMRSMANKNQLNANLLPSRLYFRQILHCLSRVASGYKKTVVDRSETIDPLVFAAFRLH